MKYEVHSTVLHEKGFPSLLCNTPSIGVKVNFIRFGICDGVVLLLTIPFSVSVYARFISKSR